MSLRYRATAAVAVVAAAPLFLITACTSNHTTSAQQQSTTDTIATMDLGAIERDFRAADFAVVPDSVQRQDGAVTLQLRVGCTNGLTPTFSVLDNNPPLLVAADPATQGNSEPSVLLISRQPTPEVASDLKLCTPTT